MNLQGFKFFRGDSKLNAWSEVKQWLASRGLLKPLHRLGELLPVDVRAVMPRSL
jgi:hypothetical protein